MPAVNQQGKIMEEGPKPKIKITPEQYADLAEVNFQANQRWQKIEAILEKIKEGTETSEDLKEMERLSREHIDGVEQMKRMMKDFKII